jgi:hypothetical protein
MKRSIHAVLLVLALATVGSVIATPSTAADQPAAQAPVAQTAQDGTLTEPAVGPDAGDPLCLDGMTNGLVISPSLSPIAQPQVGAPCCADLCEQICGVGEACLCKRCQVLGCGV